MGIRVIDSIWGGKWNTVSKIYINVKPFNYFIHLNIRMLKKLINIENKNRNEYEANYCIF
jgi:hypothetical protein